HGVPGRTPAHRHLAREHGAAEVQPVRGGPAIPLLKRRCPKQAYPTFERKALSAGANPCAGTPLAAWSSIRFAAMETLVHARFVHAGFELRCTCPPPAVHERGHSRRPRALPCRVAPWHGRSSSSLVPQAISAGRSLPPCATTFRSLAWTARPWKASVFRSSRPIFRLTMRWHVPFD